MNNSNNHRVLIETEDKRYRIIEVVDTDIDLENLKGDVFNPKHILEMHGPDKTVDQLAEEEKAFEEEVSEQGVYGYVLERWNPEPDAGWEHVNSCFGFVGQYDWNSKSKYHHYIVDELFSSLQDMVKGA